MTDTGFRKQWVNRTYHSQYQNRTREFFFDLANGGMIVDLAKKLGVTYGSIHTSIKNNRIARPLKLKIEANLNLTPEQEDELLFLYQNEDKNI